MATLQKIRSKGTILLIILGLALFAFIAEELVRALSSSQNANHQVIGQIYGENINYQEFNDLISEYENAVKLSNGGQNLTEAQNIQLHDQVWNDLVSEKIFQHEAEELGLSVSEPEIQNIINTGSSQLLRQTPFVNQQTGQFDVNLLKQFLTNYEEIQTNPEYPDAQREAMASYYKYWKFVEKQLRKEILTQKYQTLLSSCILSNPVSAKAAFEARNNESSILLAAVPYTTIKDTDVEPTEAELKAKYDEMQKQFPDLFDMQQEARDVKYILVPVTASKADEKALEQELTEFAQTMDSTDNLANTIRESRSSISYNGLPVSRKSLPADIATAIDSMAPGTQKGPFKNERENTLNVVRYIAKVQQPDSVQYRIISVNGKDEKAAKSADSIFTALNAGAPIDSVAKRYNQAAEAQWITSAQVDKSTLRDDDKRFVQTLFTAPAGVAQKLDISTGTLIVKVIERRNIIDKYDVAVIKRPIDFSEETHNDIWNKFSSFLAANPTMADIEANAAKAGYTVQNAQYMTSADHYVANTPSTTDALRWVFNNKTKVGDVSELFEAGQANDQLLVVMLSAIHKKGMRDINDQNLHQILTEEVAKDKKAAQIIEKIRGAKSVAEVAKMAGAVQDTISHISFASPVFVQKIATQEASLCGAVSAAKKGQFVTGVRGEGAVYAFQVLEQTKLEGKFDRKQEETQQTQGFMRSMSGLMQTLARKAKVTDNRYKFYQ